MIDDKPGLNVIHLVLPDACCQIHPGLLKGITVEINGPDNGLGCPSHDHRHAGKGQTSLLLLLGPGEFDKPWGQADQILRGFAGDVADDCVAGGRVVATRWVECQYTIRITGRGDERRR